MEITFSFVVNNVEERLGLQFNAFTMVMLCSVE